MYFTDVTGGFELNHPIFSLIVFAYHVDHLFILGFLHYETHLEDLNSSWKTLIWLELFFLCLYHRSLTRNFEFIQAIDYRN